LRFILIILGLIFLYLIRQVVFIVFVALIIAAAVDGPVDWLARHKIRRPFGTAVVYLTIFLFLGSFSYLVLPPLAGQIKLLASNLPAYLDTLGTSFSLLQQRIGVTALQNILQQFGNQLSGSAGNIFSTAIGFLGGLFSAAVILVISVYLVIQDKGIKNFLASITPSEKRAYVLDLADRIQLKLGRWLRGQLVLMVIIGVLTYIGLLLLKIKFALTLALLAGLLEIIPYLGPILSSVPAILLALTQSPFLALMVLVLFVIVQQLEGYIFSPFVMKRALGLNPLVVMISIIIGGQLGGVLGVLVAVPLVAAMAVVFGDIFAKNPE
jgi:predicted PurR-regulated permease PerM